MAIIQFLGQPEGRSVNAGAVRYINLFPHSTQDGRSIVFGTPGIAALPFLSQSITNIRGLHVMGSYLYAVAGKTLYQISAAGIVIQKGLLGASVGNSSPVGMADNGQQLLIVDGEYGYLYTSPTSTSYTIGSPGVTVTPDTFYQINAFNAAGASFPVGAKTCTFLDGYFIVDAGGSTRTYFYSDIYDGMTWQALDYNAAEAAPDNLMAVVATFGFLYLLCSIHSEIWYDAGDPNSVFLRCEGQTTNIGILNPYTACKVGDTGGMVAWLATSQSGGVYVVANAGGTNNQRISTPELEYWLAKYTVAQIGAAVAYSYTDQGHIFYVLVIGNDTWVYDFVTQLWHQRSSNGGPHAVQYYAWFNGIHYVAGPSIGLAQMGMDFYSELGGTIYRTLISPTLGDDESRISYQSVQIDMERGTTPLLTGQGSNPQLMLSWSDDAGHSYSNEVMGSVGQQGNYTQRVIFRRLGRAFRRTFKIRITDPIKVVLIAATVKTE